MLTFLIILAIVIAGVVVWRRRVPLLAKLLGQSESRIRQINRKASPSAGCGGFDPLGRDLVPPSRSPLHHHRSHR